MKRTLAVDQKGCQ